MIRTALTGTGGCVAFRDRLFCPAVAMIACAAVLLTGAVAKAQVLPDTVILNGPSNLVTDTTALVMWKVASDAPGRDSHWVAWSGGSSIAANAFTVVSGVADDNGEVSALLTGLRPGQTYRYQVQSGPNLIGGGFTAGDGATPVQTFVTLANPDTKAADAITAVVNRSQAQANAGAASNPGLCGVASSTLTIVSQPPSAYMAVTNVIVQPPLQSSGGMLSLGGATLANAVTFGATFNTAPLLFVSMAPVLCPTNSRSVTRDGGILKVVFSWGTGISNNFINSVVTQPVFLTLTNQVAPVSIAFNSIAVTNDRISNPGIIIGPPPSYWISGTGNVYRSILMGSTNLVLLSQGSSITNISIPPPSPAPTSSVPASIVVESNTVVQTASETPSPSEPTPIDIFAGWMPQGEGWIPGFTLTQLVTKISHRASFVLPVPRKYPNENLLDYTVTVKDMAQLAYELKTAYNLTSYQSAWNNLWRKGEKNLMDKSFKWYYILPNGEVYKGMASSGGTLIGKLDESYYANPSLLVNAQPSTGAGLPELTHEDAAGGLGAITFAPMATGRFQVMIEVSSISQTAIRWTKQFQLTVENALPDFTVADVTIGHHESHVLTVPQTDDDGDALTYTVSIKDVAQLAYELKTACNLTTYQSAWNNLWRKGEKNLTDKNFNWYYILPNGALYKGMAMSGGTLVGQLDPSYYANPALLLNAQPGAGSGLPDVTQVPGSITFAPKMAGRFLVTVVADDGSGGKVTRKFMLTVQNALPDFTVADATINRTGSHTLAVPQTDSDGDVVAYSVSIKDVAQLAYELKTAYKLAAHQSAWNNLWRKGEKNLTDKNFNWYYILPNGALYKGMAISGGTLIGQLDPSYYANPGLLLNSLPNAGAGLPDVVQTPGAITFTPKMAGRFLVTVGADDGFGGKVSRKFTLAVN